MAELWEDEDLDYADDDPLDHLDYYDELEDGFDPFTDLSLAPIYLPSWSDPVPLPSPLAVPPIQSLIAQPQHNQIANVVAKEDDRSLKKKSRKGKTELISKLQQVVYLAVHNGHLKPIEVAADELKKRGLCKNPLDFSVDKQKYSPLMHACEGDKMSLIKVLLEKGASIAYRGKNSKGINPVHIACSKENVEVLQLLLTNAPKQQLESALNAKTAKAKERWTPLMYAVKYGHLEAVKLLLGTGVVKLDACTKKMMTVLHLVVHYHQLDCLKELHSYITQTIPDYSILYQTKDKKGWNILHYACAGGSVEVVKWLLGSIPALRDAKTLNHGSKKNFTPLLVACEYQKLEVVRYLLREVPGIDASAHAVETDPKTGSLGSKTGLHLAAIHDSPEIAEELITKQCPLDVQDCVVDTALHIAHRKASRDVAEILKRTPGGEKLTQMKNNAGQTPDQIPPGDVIPPEIKKRGPKAEEAYRRALRKGKEKIPRCSLQILGEQRVGKTSVLRSLIGKHFVEDLDPTRGIDNELIDTVDIRSVSMAAWKEVKPEDQVKDNDTLFVTGMVGELDREGVLINQQDLDGETTQTKELENVSEEELLLRIEEALTIFELPPKAPHPRVALHKQPTTIRPYQQDSQIMATPVGIKAGAQPQPFKQRAVSPPRFNPKREERSKHAESTSNPNPRPPRERPPNPTQLRHTLPNQQPVSTENQGQVPRTPGTLISRRHHRTVGRTIKAPRARKEPTLHLNTYDFAGQKQYRPMHHCFITGRALYLVVFNLQRMVAYLDSKVVDESSKEIPLEEIRYWLNSIHAHIHISTEEDERMKRVFLVGTHKAPKDPKHGRPLTENDLEKVHKELKKIFYDNDKDNRSVNHLCFTCDGQQIFAAVENSLDGKGEREASGITALQKELKDVSKVLPFLQEQHPILWLRFERGLLQLREECCRSKTPPLIKLEEVQKIGLECGIEEPDISYALQFFHDTGTIVCLKKVSSLFLSKEEKSQLDSFVLLDLKWLIEVMKRVMELKKGDPMYTGEDIRDLEKGGIANASLLGKCWEGCYSESAHCSFKQLCLILQAYCLIYPLPLPAAVCPDRAKSKPAALATAQQLPFRSLSERDANLSKDTKYLVPCMLPNEPIPDDSIKKISFYFDFSGFLPAEIFHHLVCLMTAKSAATRGRKQAPEFSATRCRFYNVEGRKWQLEMEPDCHRIKISIIPKHDEKDSMKPSLFISLIHHDYLQRICEKRSLQGLTYHGGPLLERCVTAGCSWSGTLPFVSYPEPEEPDYSSKVACKCNHEYDINSLLKVPEQSLGPLSDRPQATPEQQPQQTIINVHSGTAIVSTGDRATIHPQPGAAPMIQSQELPAHIVLPSTSHVVDSDTPGPTAGLIQPLCIPQLEASCTSNLQVEELNDESDDHYEITEYLKPLEQNKDQLVELGKQLGLRYSRLKSMKVSANFLDELVLMWLKKEDNVKKRCPPTWENLATAVAKIGQTEIAENITTEKCTC